MSDIQVPITINLEQAEALFKLCAMKTAAPDEVSSVFASVPKEKHDELRRLLEERSSGSAHASQLFRLMFAIYRFLHRELEANKRVEVFVDGEKVIVFELLNNLVFPHMDNSKPPKEEPLMCCDMEIIRSCPKCGRYV